MPAATPGLFLRETIQRRARERPHPANISVQLAENCIRLHGVTKVRRMLDPFLGIGNSAVAARQLGLTSFVGFEIEKSYLDLAARRLNLLSR